MPTQRSADSKNLHKTTKPPVGKGELDADLADDLESASDEESAGLKELSFDDDSRSDRHRAIGSEQSAQNDNAPDESIDELDEGNDIGEQDER